MTDDEIATDNRIEEATPLVDEALAATDRKAHNQEELSALRSEVARLQDSLREAASGAGRLAISATGNRPKDVAAESGLVASAAQAAYSAKSR